jgi:hypothetical protein
LQAKVIPFWAWSSRNTFAYNVLFKGESVSCELLQQCYAGAGFGLTQRYDVVPNQCDREMNTAKDIAPKTVCNREKE